MAILTPRGPLDANADLAAAVERFVEGPGRRAVHLRVLRGGSGEVSVHADLPLPSGSMLKVALAMIVYEQAARGLLDLDSEVAVGDVSVGDELSVLASLEPARRLSYRELCGVMLQISDNAIAGHLVGLLGIEAINAQLPELGCLGTRLSVGFPPGVSGEAMRANVTTARDMVALLELMATEPRFGDLALAVRRGLHRNRIPLRIPNQLVVFEKGGTQLGVANDAAVIRGERVDIGLAVLTEGQADTAVAGLEIADFAGRAWSALGERTAW